MDRQDALRGLAADLRGLESASVLHRIETAGRMARTLGELLADYVVEARRPRRAGGFWLHGINGQYSWGELAAALHVTRQAARQRYGPAVVAAYGEAGKGYAGTLEEVSSETVR